MLREVDKKDAVLAALDGRLVYRITKNTDGSVHAADLTECLGNLLYFDKVKFVADIPEPEPQEEKPIQQEESKADTPEPAGEVPPPTAKKKKMVKVDVGKIMALHNAGWSNVKIADEMDLHPVTVGKYIKQEETADGNRQD